MYYPLGCYVHNGKSYEYYLIPNLAPWFTVTGG